MEPAPAHRSGWWRWLPWLLLALLLLGLALFGLRDAAAKNGDNEGEVRRCKGGSSRESVACAMKAGTLDELKACGFMATKAKKE